MEGYGHQALAWRGEVLFGQSWSSGLGMAMSGRVRFGKGISARYVKARSGEVRFGSIVVNSGTVRHVRARVAVRQVLGFAVGHGSVRYATVG